MNKPVRRFFFAHLRDGRALRSSPLTWMAIGDEAEFLSDALLVRAVQDRLGQVVDEICLRLLLLSKGDRARRLRAIFDRNVIGTEHWSSLAPGLYVSRRQFFRERKLLCDEICTLLEAKLQSRAGAVLAQPAPEDLAFNDAALALQSGDPETAERIVETLGLSLPAGEPRARALTLAADYEIDRLHFDDAATHCALAASVASQIADFESRAIASAHVNVTRSRLFFMRTQYEQARTEMTAAVRTLSELSPPPNGKRSDLMQAILVRQAEIAIHTGDANGAVEHMQHLRYALGRNGGPSEAFFDLASIESATEMFAGRLQGALATLVEAFSIARRLGFNRQIVRLSLERAWLEIQIDRTRGPALSAQLAALVNAVHVPELRLEAALFCAMNDIPRKALEYGSRARAMAPSETLWSARSMMCQADASFKLGRIADAWDLASEAERLTGRLGNQRMRAAALAPMARIKRRCGDTKAATTLSRDAAELFRLYGTAPERTRFAERSECRN